MKTIKIIEKSSNDEIGRLEVPDNVVISDCQIVSIKYLTSNGNTSFKLASGRTIIMHESTFLNLLMELRDSGRKIDAIKLFREFEEINKEESNLAVAKEFVENLRFDTIERKFYIWEE
jgi:sensor histidine kinase regulating citrate/malate metabolism